ncbi:MAG TPA: TadE family protein [Gemmataceae bacterium]|nr:TadE family protein [Gemmataceae bacterium]
MHRRAAARRRAASVVESAIVYPATFLVVLGLAVGGLGVFRYQQVASLAREGARWASVRGGQYASETGNAAATQQDVYNNVIKPNGFGLDPSRLGCTVTWSNNDNWPVRISSDNGAATANTVTVTVTYQWLPEAYLGGLTLSSTSVVPVAY